MNKTTDILESDIEYLMEFIMNKATDADLESEELNRAMVALGIYDTINIVNTAPSNVTIN
jgi:hypothetical protein